jgi:hypothetical protein
MRVTVARCLLCGEECGGAGTSFYGRPTTHAFEPTSLGQWYRNAGRYTRYHLAHSDWVNTGRAVCGAGIGHPAFVASRPQEFAGRPRCAHCERHWRARCK